ncbi:hypothetical protein MTR67_047148 [Solanum verrucosum]|uniref:Uncharacterized protein n=1 Tax=Solanum verrucosum TaxID=315347 RepID=A0AAF0ZXX4_SOLVR|nr:hypothetical protein MTR67_047148 [Solanum verrucosum]
MNNGMRQPMHSILCLLSIFQDEKASFDQKIFVNTMVKTHTFLSILTNVVIAISSKDDGMFPVEMSHFQLHLPVRETSCLVKCFCIYKGFGFSTGVLTSLPNQVMGDEKRTF